MLQVIAYQIADNIDIKQVKASFKGDLYFSDSNELFYREQGDALIYVFQYGVVCFLNYPDEKIKAFLDMLGPYCRNLFQEKMSEEFTIIANASRNKIGYNEIEIISPDIEVLRLVMLNVSQSATLDYYTELTEKLLEETNHHTRNLELKGKLAISGGNLKRYIGKTLYLRNRIAENLYIFDSPPEVWEDESLNQINAGMKRTFDLQERFRNIQEGLSIIKENLDLFKDILQYRNSTMLEYIIIALILVEVVNLFIEKLL